MAYILDDDSPRAATVNDRERGRLLGILHEICLDRANTDLREFAMTLAALALHATWEQVADALGTSQPQARERYEALRRRFAPPEQVVFTTDGSVRLTPQGPVPVEGPVGLDAWGFPDHDGEEREEVIFVPVRDDATPSQVADAQHLLNHTARWIVKGKFAVLPPGAKILPAHSGREFIKLPSDMTGPDYVRRYRAAREWRAVWPGLECRLAAFGGENDYAHANVEFRLTPAEDAR